MSDNLREPSQPAAIMATYADWRPVKGRKVLQLTFEVPLEQQAEVLTMLGAPMPDQQRWCAIALMDTASRAAPAEKRSPEVHFPDGVPSGLGGTSGEPLKREKTPAERAYTRSVMLPRDERFQAWAWDYLRRQGVTPPDNPTVSFAEKFIKDLCCNGNSRKMMMEVPEYMDRFIRLETSYRIDIGEISAPR